MECNARPNRVGDIQSPTEGEVRRRAAERRGQGEAARLPCARAAAPRLPLALRAALALPAAPPAPR